ncbi:MAG: AMP-binding protein [Candidatus Melainabacteria bacterium]|nr:AMP-binding protein [Candidatus Melainabacteria bacterium]
MSQLYQKLLENAQQDPARTTLIEGDTRWSAEQFLSQVNRLAALLQQAFNIRSHDRVALMFWNQKELLLGLFACRQLGAVPLPINIQMPPSDIQYVFQDAGVTLVLAATDLARPWVESGNPLPFAVILSGNAEETGVLGHLPCLETLLAETAPLAPEWCAPHEADTLSILLYTSGTTGNPKGVMLSEDNLLGNLHGFHQVLAFSEQETILLALPLFHAYGLMIGLYAFWMKIPIVLVPKFAPKSMVKAIAEERVTLLPLVPTMFTLLLEMAERTGLEAFNSLKLCVSGGASLPTALLKRIEETLGVVVLEGYGLTETSPVLAVNDPKVGSVPGAVGRVLPNVEMRLVDANENVIPVAPGVASAEGEVRVKGPNVMLGYYQLPEATQEVFDADGWFKTGDLGHFDEHGNLLISGGRIKDLVIKAGENISPLGVERVLYQHPAVAEASVIGVKDDRLGEAILACIELKPDTTLTEAALKAHCREHLTPLMVPDRVRFYASLPKGPTGKILKKVLRAENQPETLVAHSATTT